MAREQVAVQGSGTVQAAASQEQHPGLVMQKQTYRYVQNNIKVKMTFANCRWPPKAFTSPTQCTPKLGGVR